MSRSAAPATKSHSQTSPNSVLATQKWMSSVICVTSETSFPIKVTLQPHQILRLPGKMNFVIDRRDIWNVVSKARSKQSHPPTSPNTASATKFWGQHFNRESWIASTNRKTIRTHSEHIRGESEHEIVISHPPLRRPSRFDLGDDFVLKNTKFTRFGYLLTMSRSAAPATKSHIHTSNIAPATQKWRSSVICVTYETSFTMRGESKVTLQSHQILRLPRKMNLVIDRRDINVISNARSNKRQPPTSPNIAPATQNECHLWSASYMKRHFQCAEQAKSPFKLTKYCACHQILSSRFEREIPELLSANRKTIRTHSDHIRRKSDTKSSSRTRRPSRFDLLEMILLKNTTFTRFGYLPKSHEMLRLPRKVTLQPHQIQRLPYKINDHTYEASFPISGPSKVTVQTQQILRLPRET